MALRYNGEPVRRFVKSVGMVTIDDKASQGLLTLAKDAGVVGIDEIAPETAPLPPDGGVKKPLTKQDNGEGK